MILLAGCSADKAFTPTVTSEPEQSSLPVASLPTETMVADEHAPIAVSVILTDYRVSSFVSAFEVGKTYEFTVSNNGAVAHGFVIEPLGATNQPLTNNGQSAAIQLINPGESMTLTWTFTTIGRLQIASHLNDDYAKGMVQTGISAS
jgi:uncharacterized cupredoxin-like copper-binding protein